MEQMTHHREYGLKFNRYYTKEEKHPYDGVDWSLRDVILSSYEGEVLFEQNGVEFPTSWSSNAVQIVTSKYFHGQLNTSQRETSLKQLIDRVAETIAQWGLDEGYFSDQKDYEIFKHELIDILLHQRASFNSPVWFNCGTVEKPQCSACFINSLEDNMESILNLAKTEGLIFKFGSGSGVNVSKLRAKGEPLSTGGTSSGPLSFMKGYDAFAGSIKSGGKTRRAAKMVLMDVDHPDVEDFIESKVAEEKKAWALIDAGYDGSFTGEAYSSIFFQNANHSVRVTDEFMEAVKNDTMWELRGRVDNKVLKRVKARELLTQIAEATHLCGDPGLQYDTTINNWHTCKSTGRINASNPCSEYIFLDDTACNLASINLMKYRKEDGSFDIRGFIHTINILIAAQEIIVGKASYPTELIEKNSHIYRTLGLGYTNLGALLMSLGLPYDSDEGRNVAAAITSLMTGQAYLQSSRIAANLGPFSDYARNKDDMIDVMQMHRGNAQRLKSTAVDTKLFEAARMVWNEVIESGKEFGYRNAQASVLAPTGTISFMMDADTTGIEPDIALVKYKKLVGGGYMKMVNTTVPMALRRLGYDDTTVDKIIQYIDEHGMIEGCPDLDTAHLPVFDTSIKPSGGSRTIHHMGHVKMMSATQPFLSGAISKTVNMPEDCTVEEITETYIKAWEMGLKAIAIYRDNSKRLQPLNTKSTEEEESSNVLEKHDIQPRTPYRRRLPETRNSRTHKFEVDGHEGYITVGLYEDNTPGEVFIQMSKQGSTLGGVMDSLAVLISMSLQYGVPLSVLTRKFVHTKFEPSGYTSNPKIPMASSVIDYIFRWLALEFLPSDERPGVIDYSKLSDNPIPEKEVYSGQNDEIKGDNKICYNCGAIAVRSGSCYACPECGSTSGCS
ncbi:MAG: vitamin B12-dependent ribonucleotide reductase [Candidatus Heimdallarchaeota archaeon]|nr:vitamin B12-dependent ribonucleotide reductase [Candidatus Heimdallarchaeota archaeon]MDH5644858.1 vitamin B12-dependent ribonucleotide reductase [Candidatus Heimdallarchaeota archaeon]